MCHSAKMMLLPMMVVALMSTVSVKGSAIPMWEYLSKDEKMSYLYSMFANQVDEYCEFSEMRDCNRQLLKFGLGKLKDMPEDHLDVMDPYQRGANSLIWDSMMEGHEMMSKQQPSTNRKKSSTTPKPNAYDDNDDFFNHNNQQTNGADFQSQASAKIETVVYRVPPPPRHYRIYSNGPSQYFAQPGPVNVPTTHNNLPASVLQQGPNGFALSSFDTQKPHHPAPNNNAKPAPPKIASKSEDNIRTNYNNGEYFEHPLTGPMVVRVHLDGSPVTDESTSLPQDEDLRQYRMSKAKIPTFF